MGEGEPVIILHGFLGMLDNWKTFGRKLSEDFNVFLIDQRDHGKSPWTDAFNYQLLAEDLLHFIESQELEKVNLIGHSMGGKTIMKFAEGHFDLINKMVVVDVAPVEYPRMHDYILRALNSITPSSFSSRNEVDEKLSEMIDEYGVRQFLMKNLKRNSEGGFQWKMNLKLLTDAYDNVSDDPVNGPVLTDTLFVGGTKSNYITIESHDHIKQVFPNSSIKMIEGAGHWVHAEKPEELLMMVKEYFTAL